MDRGLKTMQERVLDFARAPEVLDHFRAGGAGWQTRINETLEKAVQREKKKAKA